MNIMNKIVDLPDLKPVFKQIRFKAFYHVTEIIHDQPVFQLDFDLEVQEMMKLHSRREETRDMEE